MTHSSNIYSQGQGTISTAQFPSYPVQQTRNPSSSDIKGQFGLYPIGQNWINTTDGSVFELVSFTSSGGTITANWTALNTAGASGILTLTGNSGGSVSGDGLRNLNLVGGTGVDVVGSPGTNTLTFSLTGGGAAIDSIAIDKSTSPGTSPVVPNGSGLVTITGGQVAAGSNTTAIQTNSIAANSFSVQVQRSNAEASSTVGSNGVSHYNSADFSVDSNGFVSLTSSGVTRLVNVDANTPPGTDPVTPASGGAITVTGGQVAAGTTANVIQTNSLAANTYTIQVQRSSTSVGSNVALNGVAHFNSADFTIDANGFVSAIGGGGGSGFTVVNVQTFPSTGTYTPTAGMAYCAVQMVGGGGGGGGASIDGGAQSPSGSGGGGGQYAFQVFSAATIGASKAVTIGAGGAGGVGAADGSNGGTTSLGALLSVSGGVKGQYMRTNGPIQEGGDGGQALVGSASYSSFGGGGGYAINVGGAVVSGAGGSSLLSPGGKARGIAANGVSGGGYGGGGSGGVASAGVPATGGTGDNGVVIITEFIS